VGRLAVQPVRRRPKVAGALLLAGAYVLTWVIFRVFFNYEFMQGAPVYLASAPHGLFNAVSSLVFYVTALAVMFPGAVLRSVAAHEGAVGDAAAGARPRVDDHLRRGRVGGDAGDRVGRWGWIRWWS
jgi:hypothetical protein